MLSSVMQLAVLDDFVLINLYLIYVRTWFA